MKNQWAFLYYPFIILLRHSTFIILSLPQQHLKKGAAFRQAPPTNHLQKNQCPFPGDMELNKLPATFLPWSIPAWMLGL